MNNNLTEMVFILDMSGSMYSLTDDTIGGYNTLLNEQKAKEGEANVTTVLFNHNYTVLHDRVNIKEVKELTTLEYTPMGNTAMLDAVGNTIQSIGQKLANMHEEERPGNVVVTIITDGMENASREFNWQQIQSMIKEQREKYSWIFTFIGANIDVMDISQRMGIDSRLAKSYTASKVGTGSVYKAMSKTLGASRDMSMKRKSKVKVSKEELDGAIGAMSDIMDEEIK
jgi:uncharacterized protein YegL